MRIRSRPSCGAANATRSPSAWTPSTKKRSRNEATLLGLERFLHALEERAVFFGLVAHPGELLEQFALALVELRGNGDVHAHHVIAARTAAHGRHALAAHPVHRAGLRS